MAFHTYEDVSVNPFAGVLKISIDKACNDSPQYHYIRI
jgi:hypothetical protein